MPAHTKNKETKGIFKPVKYKKLNIAGKSKKEVGDVGEEFVCAHIPCQTCGIRKWYNLNRENPNFPGVDLKCMHCGTYAQVKTGKHPLHPHRTGWKIPTSPATVRDTLRKYKRNMRYIHVAYDAKHRVSEVCVTEPLTCKNIFHTENCIVSYDLHNWTPAMLQSM